MFASLNDQGVVLIEERWIGRKVPLKQLTDLFVGLFSSSQVMPFQNPACIRIDHKYGMASSIQQNGIGSFRADPVHREQLFTEFRGRCGEETIQRAVILPSKKMDERFQFPSLLTKITRRADQAGKPSERYVFQGHWREQMFATQRRNGEFDIRPTGALGENGSNDHLKARAPGPPVLWAVSAE